MFHNAVGVASRLRGDLAAALLRTFISRAIAAVGSFILIIVLGRLYGTVGVGVFALAQSLIMAITLLGRYGMDRAIIRFVGRDLQSPDVLAYLRHACSRALLISTIGGVALFFTRELWARFFDSVALSSVLIGIAIAAPAFTVAFVCSGFMNAVRKPATACLLQNGGVASITAGLVIPVQTLILPAAGLANIGIAYAAAAWILVTISLWLCRRWMRLNRGSARGRKRRVSMHEFDRSSAAFFYASLSQFMISVSGIWIIGYFLHGGDVGLFKAALQVSMLIITILYVINATFAPRFAALFRERNWDVLNTLARRGALLGFGLAAAPAMIFMATPEWILGVMGNDFAGAVTPLRLLVIGQLINVSCGPVGFLLNMSGYESLMRNISWMANTVGILAILSLTPTLGIVGAAVGVSIASVVQAVASVYFVWRRLGIWVPFLPNILERIGLRAQTSVEGSAKI